MFGRRGSPIPSVGRAAGDRERDEKADRELVEGGVMTDYAVSRRDLGLAAAAALLVSASKAAKASPKVRGIIYGVTSTKDLLWYRHDGRDFGDRKWASNSGHKI